MLSFHPKPRYVWSFLACTPHTIQICIITKLPESGDLYGNITEFEVAEGDPPPPQMK